MVRTGFYFASVPALAGALTLWQGWWGASLVLFALVAFVLFFFRDPERAVPELAGAVVSPADGRVLAIDQAELEGRAWTRVSIFLSVFDVHVNRAPIAGTVTAVRYQPGKFHIASTRAASRENEQNQVTLEGEGTRVVFKQIAGVLARRIEFWKQPGDDLERGQRVGMIRFGSRAEVYLQPHYRVQVQPGTHVRGGATVLAMRG
ncbi:MAG: phosphatidylserine decarboxylase family protein [Terriglobia bacterium]